MDVLGQMQSRLQAVNRLALTRLRPGDALQMIAEQERLQRWVGEAARLEEIAAASIEEALRAYRQNPHLKDLRRIRLVCYGCTQDGRAGRLIESREHFGKLLATVNLYTGRRRTFRKLYRGLLNGYFSYDCNSPLVDPAGRTNRELLRQFLLEHLAALPVGVFTPDWVLALSEYPELLDENPGLRLVTRLLQGEVFNELRERLQIGVESWLVQQIVMAPLSSVVQMGDATLKDQLDSLLLLLSDYPLYAATGLSLLLDRYAQCADPEEHALLRDFSVELWGNPWLAPHQWQCGEPARVMLVYWLRRYLLAEFFGLLSDVEPAHSRRLNFWEIYSGDMTGMYFALGRDAYAPGNMPLYKFRRMAKGLIAKLGEEKHDVHTCIMQFAHCHVVEFNRERNAAYFYDTRQGIPSFYFSKGWVEIGAVSAQHVAEGADVVRLSKPLRHQDTSKLTWEGRFAQEMGMTASAVDAFCRKYQCRCEDAQDRRRWIYPDNRLQHGPEVWSILEGWGFRFSSKQQGYYL